MSTTVLGQGMPKVRKNDYAAYFENSQENKKNGSENCTNKTQHRTV